MKTLRLASAYKKDLKLIARRGYDLNLLGNVLDFCAQASSFQLPDATIPSRANGEAGGSATSSPIGC
jgi:hypothetical protein